MRRVVFGVFAAGITVVVFNQVLKNRGEKIKFLRKNRLETETCQLGNQRVAKIIASVSSGCSSGIWARIAYHNAAICLHAPP